MSPNEISFSVSQCFAVQLSCLRLQRYTFFFIQQTFPYSFLRNTPKLLAQQGNLSQLGSLIITGHTALLLISFLPRIARIERICLWEKNRSKSLLLSPGLRLCSLMRMLTHVSELPCLTLSIRLVCPLADRKPSKQNSCRWQYKMSTYQRLLTITLDLRGACPQDVSS